MPLSNRLPPDTNDNARTPIGVVLQSIQSQNALHALDVTPADLSAVDEHGREQAVLRETAKAIKGELDKLADPADGEEGDLAAVQKSRQQITELLAADLLSPQDLETARTGLERLRAHVSNSYERVKCAAMAIQDRLTMEGDESKESLALEEIDADPEGQFEDYVPDYLEYNKKKEKANYKNDIVAKNMFQ